MFKQVIKLCLMISTSLCLALSIYRGPHIDRSTIVGAWYHIKALILQDVCDSITVNANEWMRISRTPSRESYISVKTRKVILKTRPQYEAFTRLIWQHLEFIQWIAPSSLLGLLIFFEVQGLLYRRRRHVSGARKTHPNLLSLRLRSSLKASPYRIGAIPLLKGSETRHLMITGGTGSGKTNCMHHLLQQIRAQNRSAIVVDVTGSLVDRHWREGDILLNPLDSRSLSWHPWLEAESSTERKALAESLIPLSCSDREDYWRAAARAVFTALMEKLEDEQSIGHLLNLALTVPLQELCEYLEDTKATAFIDIASEKTAASVRSVLASFIECLENLHDRRELFSIKRWLQKSTEDQWLFLSCSPQERSALNPLISTWISVAIRGIMSLSVDLDRRIFFVIDELPALQRVRDLEMLLAESRKFGGCALLSLQSPAQLESIYGPHVTQTIIGNCASKVVFSEQDPVIAQRISKIFGDCDFKEIQEGISYGAHQMRDGVSLNVQSKREPLISSFDIQSLPPNNAYVRLPGTYPISKTKLKIAR
jgi:type IV conjugative transfer system coupling protein TraD